MNFMINEKVQQIYDTAKKIDYFMTFGSQIRNDRILASIRCDGRSKALAVAMKLIALFKDEAEIILNDNNIVIVASDIRG